VKSSLKWRGLKNPQTEMPHDVAVTASESDTDTEVLTKEAGDLRE